MNHRLFLEHLMCVSLVLVAVNSEAQVTQLSNTVTLGTEYLGCDANSTQPLRFTTELNFPHQWRTQNLLRMRLLETLTGQTINIYTNENLSGNLGIGQFFSTDVNRPFSLLHIDNGGIQNTGYRPWHRAGITFTQGSDLGWIGLRNEFNDVNSMTLCWADNTVGDGPDRFKFIFIAPPVAGNGTAGTINGLEAARFRPVTGGNQTYFGLGDWLTAALDPTERLDLLDGRLRIRQLPDDAATTDAYRVMVVDDTNDPLERGVVKWANISLSGDCDWVIQNPDPHVSSVYTGSNCPWSLIHGVGVGVDIPRAKLHVFHSEFELLARIGTWSHVVANDMINEFYGVLGESGPMPPEGYVGHVEGVRGFAYNGKTTIGVRGYGLFNSLEQGAGTGHLVGVHGEAEAVDPTQISFMAGVYGTFTAPTGTPSPWAGYFNGDVMCTTGNYQTSDEALKTNIELADPMVEEDVITQVQVHRYEFDHAGNPSMHLPAGEHLGIMAGGLEEVLPALVKEAVHPAMVDSEGNEVHAAVQFKAVNYTGLIPHLVLSNQKQQLRIAALESVIAQMQEQLAACCAAPTNSDQRNSMEPTGTVEGLERNLQIIPNPLESHATLTYTLDHSGAALLMVNTTDGKDLRTLMQANLEAGQYQLEWNTENLAPGTYYVTLFLDGERIVKKAVKVQR